jgi:hypothetical protein
VKETHLCAVSWWPLDIAPDENVGTESLPPI